MVEKFLISCTVNIVSFPTLFKGYTMLTNEERIAAIMVLKENLQGNWLTTPPAKLAQMRGCRWEDFVRAQEDLAETCGLTLQEFAIKATGTSQDIQGLIEKLENKK